MGPVSVNRLCTRIMLLLFLEFMTGCGDSNVDPGERLQPLADQPEIFPDYRDITIPPNIAPLNFQVKEDGDDFRVLLEGENGSVMRIRSRDRNLRIPPDRWDSFLKENRDASFRVTVQRAEGKKWRAFAPFVIRVAPEPIDPFLAYRLIPPGYETWSSMGLYQRDLTSFRQKPIIENRYVEDNCVNCHSFSAGSSENMLFHIRGSLGGTVIKKGEKIEKVDLKTSESLSAGVYPAWHPSGDYIAFSTNKIEQYFHAHPELTIEVMDRHSDLIIYDTEKKRVTHVPGTMGDEHMETFPCWSPGGSELYFSRSDASEFTPYDSIRYDIYRMAFDQETGQFGEAEPVFLATDNQQSASFPRISPDGKYLLCTVHAYGTFPIWHPEADLCLVDLVTGKPLMQEFVNSNDTDSYHSWSSNSKWIVFSSRRDDGQYTKLYISYLDNDSQFRKAFLLPQQDPGYYQSFFYSYNRPELITGFIDVDPREWIRTATGK